MIQLGDGEGVPSQDISYLGVLGQGMGQLPLQQAVAKMRVHHQGFPDQIWLEKGAAADGVSKGLEGIGHRVNKVRPWCNIQAVGITSATSRKLEAVSDNRYEGGAMAL